MKTIVTLIIILFTSVAHSQTCKEMVYRGVFPTTKIPVTILCKERFVIGYSTQHKSPLWVAEVLTVDQLKSPRQERTNPFRLDPTIPASQQPALSDFVGNDLDRGHMVPFEDVADNPKAAKQSFYMTNMVAQYSAHNRGIWKSLEGKVRKLPLTKKYVYIVTGPVLRDNPKTLPSGTPIPYALYKVIISPTTKESFTLIIDNNPTITSANLPMFFTTISDLRDYNPLINPVPVPINFINRKELK